jgi:hypothetical protein
MDIQVLWLLQFSHCLIGHQAHSTRTPQAMLPAETSETRGSLLSLSLAKPRYNDKEILKTYEPFTETYITNSFRKYVIKNSDTLAYVKNCIFIHFSYYYQYIFIAHDI